MNFVGGVFSYRRPDDGEDGTWCDWWLYEDLQLPLTRLSAAAGVPARRDHGQPITMDDMRKGCWDPKARLEDMDVNHVEASLASRASRASAARRSSSARTRSSPTSA